MLRVKPPKRQERLLNKKQRALLYDLRLTRGGYEKLGASGPEKNKGNPSAGKLAFHRGIPLLFPRMRRIRVAGFQPPGQKPNVTNLGIRVLARSGGHQLQTSCPVQSAAWNPEDEIRWRRYTRAAQALTSPPAVRSSGAAQSFRSSPQKNSATVPGPVWLPMVVPMLLMSTLPFSLGKACSTRSATSRASSSQADWEMKHLPL